MKEGGIPEEGMKEWEEMTLIHAGNDRDRERLEKEAALWDKMQSKPHYGTNFCFNLTIE